MGGRLCLRLAIDRPDLVHALVLVSATPGIEDASERAARVASDERWAARAEHDGVDGFLAAWLAQPMFATVPPDAPGLADRRTLTPAFLAACLRRLGTGAMAPMWDRLPEVAMPVLLAAYDRRIAQSEKSLLRTKHSARAQPNRQWASAAWAAGPHERQNAYRPSLHSDGRGGFLRRILLLLFGRGGAI